MRFPVLYLLLLLTTGCGLFSTRDAEKPDAGTGIWEAPNEPETVLVNLSNALAARNSVNYLLSFDSTRFLFEADNIVRSSDPAFQAWNYTSERSHINNLLSLLPPNKALYVVFSQQTKEDLRGGDSVRVSAVYNLFAQVTAPGAPDTMSGTADFYMSRGSELFWQIYYWRDTRSEGASTWSDLKSAIH